MLNYVKPERVSLKGHPDFSEKWVQERIKEDPSLLGLGDLVMLHAERRQPRGGRLDLLLQDVETQRRFEVELQLGPTDESHIIRTIEYWDVERKRYPQYEHCAVLVAEEVTSRFLNVISLFNGSVPLIAVRMQALRIADSLALSFTTVLDEMPRGLVGIDEATSAEPTDRAYWERKSGVLGLVDETLAVAREFDRGVELKYNLQYIGLAKQGQPNNFIAFVPRRSHVILNLKIPKSDDADRRIEESGLPAMSYEEDYGNYRIKLRPGDVQKHAAALKELVGLAHKARTEG